jgi:hypothetical protein
MFLGEIKDFMRESDRLERQAASTIITTTFSIVIFFELYYWIKLQYSFIRNCEIIKLEKSWRYRADVLSISNVVGLYKTAN